MTSINTQRSRYSHSKWLPLLAAYCLVVACHDGRRAPGAGLGTTTARIDAFPERQFNQFAPGTTSNVDVDLFTVDAAADTPSFRATDVQVESVRFGPGGAPPVSAQKLDVDGDGDQDLRFSFAGPVVALTADTNRVTMTGTLANGGTFIAGDGVNAVAVDPDDPNLPALVYYSNATDSRLLRAALPDGTVLDYEGERDSAGRPVALRSVARANPDGSQEFVQLDATGRPTAYEGRDGARWTFTWLEDQRVLASFRSPNLAEEVRAVVDLSAATPLTTAAATIIGPPRQGHHEAQVHPLLPPLALLAEYQQGEVPVLVTRCGGQPVNDAQRVEVVFSSGFSTEIRQAYLRGSGIYVARVPIGPGQFFSSLGDVCGTLADVLGKLCDSGGPAALAVAMPTICSALTAAAAPFPPVSAAIAAACPGAIGGLALYCETLGQGIPGGPSLGEQLCAGLSSSIDSALASDNLLSARAIVASPLGTGTTTYRSEVIADVPIPGPLPTLTIDIGSSSRLSDATTSPLDPAPFEGYTFSVSVSCVPSSGAIAVLSIVGTDGYQDSSAVSLTADGTASLFVPGAQDGVVDTLRAVLFQYQGGAILDEVTVSITF